MGSQQSALHQLVSFILGGFAAAVLLFFLTTSTSGGRFTGISTWANGTTAFDNAPVQEAPVTLARKRAAPTHVNAKGTAAPAEQNEELERLLRAVANEDQTVIMTSVNEVWAAQDSLLDLFLESFCSGERIAHFVLPHCYLLPADCQLMDVVHREEKRLEESLGG